MTAAAVPRFSSWAGLDVYILDQIPGPNSWPEICPQPQQRSRDTNTATLLVQSHSTICGSADGCVAEQET